MTNDLGFLKGHELAVYSTAWCPDCTRLKQWMQRNGVAHEEVDIGADAESADKLERETGKQAVPFILVDGKTWVRGYHREESARLNEGLLLEELREAVAASAK